VLVFWLKDGALVLSSTQHGTRLRPSPVVSGFA
jgi:hypothetical protein